MFEGQQHILQIHNRSMNCGWKVKHATYLTKHTKNMRYWTCMQRKQNFKCYIHQYRPTVWKTTVAVAAFNHHSMHAYEMRPFKQIPYIAQNLQRENVKQSTLIHCCFINIVHFPFSFHRERHITKSSDIARTIYNSAVLPDKRGTSRKSIKKVIHQHRKLCLTTSQ